ncbi:MAG: sugar phosphate isomerase/epimerase family protein [Kiritimatiellia bacterium]|jgi:sugar phosphate isomerase/epimerase
MEFALSTNWNSARHDAGDAIAEEALSLGFTALELSYRLTEAQYRDIHRLVSAGRVRVCSLHSPCPFPFEGIVPSPEPFSMTSPDEENRQKACSAAASTLNAAVELGASVVICHAGHVTMGNLTSRMGELRRSGNEPGRFQRFFLDRLLRQRRDRAARHLDPLRRSLSELLPLFDRAGVILAIENLPYWEGIPDETETASLLQEFPTPSLRYWHDIGHGQVRENLGIGNHVEWVEGILPSIVGCHIHDVFGLDADHLAPGQGMGVDFDSLRALAAPSILKVFEPGPVVDPEPLAAGLALVRKAWGG